MKKVKWLLSAMIVASVANANDASSNVQIKGNVQAHAQKKLHDENVAYNALDKYYLRANVGFKYTAEDASGEFNIRAFSKQFGNKLVTDVNSKSGVVQKKDYDNFIIERAFVDLKPLPMSSVRIGRWMSDFSVASHFGNYLDQNPRDPNFLFLARPAYHDGAEFSVKTGIMNSAVTVASTDKNWNTGYIRVVESIKFAQPKLSVDIGWRANVLDSLAFHDADAEALHRVFVKVMDTIMPNLMPYAEYAALQNFDEAGDKELKHVAMLGVQVPTGLKNLQLNLEGEWVQDYEIDGEDRALDWNVALAYKAGKRTKIQSYVFSDPEASAMSKVQVGSRITVSLD